jgi:hypothetical protein
MMPVIIAMEPPVPRAKRRVLVKERFIDMASPEELLMPNASATGGPIIREEKLLHDIKFLNKVFTKCDCKPSFLTYR